MKSRKIPISLLFALVILVGAGVFLLSANAARTRATQQGNNSAASQAISSTATPAPPSLRLVRNETFTNGITEWKEKSLLGRSPDEQGLWVAENGQLAQKGTPAGEPSFDETIMQIPVETAGVASIGVQVYPQGNQVVGMVFRSSDAGYYLFRVFRDGGTPPLRRELQRYDSKTGEYVSLAQDTKGKGYVDGIAQSLRVDLNGDLIQCFFQGEKVFEMRDATLTKGQAGVYTLALGDVQFDNFTFAQP